MKGASINNQRDDIELKKNEDIAWWLCLLSPFVFVSLLPVSIFDLFLSIYPYLSNVIVFGVVYRHLELCHKLLKTFSSIFYYQNPDFIINYQYHVLWLILLWNIMCVFLWFPKYSWFTWKSLLHLALDYREDNERRK